MKNPKTKKIVSSQELTRNVRIYGHAFNVDIDGYVSTSQYGKLGHIEDCVHFAELIYDLIDIFEMDREV